VTPLYDNDTLAFRRSTRLSPWRIGTAAACCLFVALLCGIGSSAAADSSSSAQMRSLDEQVQEIKSDVLGIAAELKGLEEKLLYPSNTQVAVFISLAAEAGLQLDSLAVSIDGEPVARHVYSFKELEALKKGGVQRIYTGNLPTGDHQLDVTFQGKQSGGKDVTGSQSFGFRKDVEPKLVEVTLTGQGAGEGSIELGGL
jgi:hypothetical protein